MKATCINLKMAHWGDIFVPGKEYEYTIAEPKKVSIITDNEKYWYYTGLIAGSIDWIRKGYTQETLHKVIPGYLNHNEVMEKYTIKVELPFVNIKGDDNQIYTLCSMSKEEILSNHKVELNDKGGIAFNYTIYLIDEYFDYAQIRRDRKLKELGI